MFSSILKRFFEFGDLLAFFVVFVFLVGSDRVSSTRMQANLGHTMHDGLIVDSDFKENYRT